MACNLVQPDCILKYRYATRCIHYRFSDPACKPGFESSTCEVLYESFHDFVCPQYHCVSRDMCYSRDSFCSCCFTFIRTLTVNTCFRNNPNCSKVWVYPKSFEKCSKCCNCTKPCSVIEKAPKKWKQPSELYVHRISYDTKSKQVLIDVRTESKISEIDQLKTRLACNV